MAGQGSEKHPMVESDVHRSPGGKWFQSSPAKSPLILSLPDTSKLWGEEQGKTKRPKIVLSHQLGHPWTGGRVDSHHTGTTPGPEQHWQRPHDNHLEDFLSEVNPA